MIRSRSTAVNMSEQFIVSTSVRVLKQKSFTLISLWQNTLKVAHVDSSHVSQNFHSQHFIFQWKLLVYSYLHIVQK